MILPFNLDLFLSGFSIAAALILGFVVFFRNRQSLTNLFFLAFTIVSSFWIAFNYLAFLKVGPELTLWLIRIVMFFAIYQAFFFFLLMRVFPESSFNIPRWWKIFLVPLVIIVSFLTLTPIIFSGVNMSGASPQPLPGPGIVLFALTAVSLVVGGIVTMVRKTFAAVGIVRTQFKLVSIGVFCMFALIITFNFVLTTAFGNTSFIPFSSTFALPFIILTTYAIAKHQLLNIKIVGTEILTFLLVVVTFFEVLLAVNFGEIIFRTGVFLALLVFSIFLIRSMRREVEQREKLEELTKKLAEANESLKELDRLKDEFVSIASHELRTPMTAIKSYLWMALYKSVKPLDNKVREYLDIAFKSTDRLIKLVQDLLTISRIEGKRLVLNFEILDIYLLAKQIYKELKISASQKKVRLVLEPQDSSLKAKVDKTRIMEVMENLIGNALKFTPPKGTVKICVERNEGEIEVRISDTGPGIAPEDLSLLFKKFSRLVNPGSKMPLAPGTGLGLYIAQQIITLHNGKIWVESKLGEGSTFIFSLPESKE